MERKNLTPEGYKPRVCAICGDDDSDSTKYHIDLSQPDGKVPICFLCWQEGEDHEREREEADDQEFRHGQDTE